MIKLHPLTAILFSITLFFISLTYSHPLYSMSILIYLVLNIVILGEKERLKNVYKYGFYMAVSIIVINLLVSKSGRTIIYRSSKLPIIGKIKITYESLAYSSNMVLKLFCILIVFILYDALTDRDEMFSFFSRYAHKLTLTLSMTINIIHRLKLEITRVKDVMILRGVDFEEKNIFRKVKLYYPILKVILISSLEGSLDRAEALYARGYGKKTRTIYSKNEVKTIDYIFYGINLVLLILFVYGLSEGYGMVKFYPTFKGFNLKDILFLGLIDIILMFTTVITWRSK